MPTDESGEGLSIPDDVLALAARLLWDTDTQAPDADWDALAASFRADLMTQVEAACEPIVRWGRASRDAEVAELREDKRALMGIASEANSDCRVLHERALAAEAVIDKVRRYADERAANGRAGRTVGSARIASDLYAILGSI